jgi:pilus assembly protein FimV
MNEYLRRKFNGDGISRRFARLLVVFCLLTPLGASSLGLGDITLHSALNQPLSADIELTALGQTRSEDIVVKLASAAAFENAGLERSLLLTTLNFQVVSGAGGTPYIKVISLDAVKEPFLDFLVEIDWPSGHLLREYTLLLDPPVVIDEEPLPVEAALAGESAAPTTDSGVRPAAASDTEADSSANVARTGILGYGPVQRSDTLWSIASQLQQASDPASVEQIMMALLQSNPEAFYNSNINELKAGHVLRVADPALLTAMTRAAAAAEVRRQYEQWMDSKQARAGMAGSTPQGGPAAAGDASSAGAVDSGPRLRLSVPEATATGMAMEGVAGEGDAGELPSSEVARLKAELVAALENSAASRQENSELRERLATLQEQIDAMQRLATLQDDTLAALQAGAGDVAAESTATADEEQAQAGTATGKAAADAVRKPASAPALEEAGAGPLDDPKIVAIAGAAGVALLGLIWLVVRRRRSTRLLVEELSEVESAHETYADTPAWMTAAQPLEDMETPVQQSPAAGMAEAVPEPDESGLDLMQTEDDEIDVLAEADVYLAYRRFDKAEELLKEASKSEPNRHDLVLKLLEVQAASGNKQAFVAQAEVFKQSLGSGGGALWDKVVAMGKRIAPEHVLFGGSALAATATVAAGAGEGDDAGLDLSADLSVLELDADIAAELDKLGGNAEEESSAQPAAAAGAADGLWAQEPTDTPLLNMDLTLDDHGLSDLGGIESDSPVTDTPEAADSQPSRKLGSASNVIDFESRAGLGQGAVDEQVAAAADGGGHDHDLDWLTGIGGDLGSLEDAGGGEDDFSSLISGEDEVGTKLDLAKAYIDMGDQESARNILSEVVQEGTQDQQHEANELMRQIG